MFSLQSYTVRIVIKILFTILLTIQIKFCISLKYLAWQDQIYFISIATVERLGDIMAKNY
jgi:hypothetical protein